MSGTPALEARFEALTENQVEAWLDDVEAEVVLNTTGFAMSSPEQPNLRPLRRENAKICEYLPAKIRRHNLIYLAAKTALVQVQEKRARPYSEHDFPTARGLPDSFRGA